MSTTLIEVQLQQAVRAALDVIKAHQEAAADLQLAKERGIIPSEVQPDQMAAPYPSGS